MQSRYKAVVVGAGPAGSIAAYEIARDGHDVLLLEKHKRPGTPLCCAEAVSKPSIEKYIRMESKWISTHVHRVEIVSPEGNSAMIHHPDAGYVLDREVFDYDLALRAVEAGCHLECEAIGTSLNHDGDNFDSIDVLKPDGSTHNIRADIFIAADGIESKIARLAGIDNLIGDDDIESLLQYRIDGIALESDKLEFYVGNEIAPRGYIWVFPKSTNSANVGLGIASRLVRGSKTAEYLKRFLNKRFKTYNIKKIHGGLVPRYQGRARFRKSNLLVAGDAARAADSLSGAGIVNAVISGYYTGRAASSCLQSKTMTDVELDMLYPGEFMKLKENELKMYSRFREVYNKLEDDDFNEIIAFVKDYFRDGPVKKLNAIKLLTNLITKRPKLIRFAKLLV